MIQLTRALTGQIILTMLSHQHNSEEYSRETLTDHTYTVKTVKDQTVYYEEHLIPPNILTVNIINHNPLYSTRLESSYKILTQLSQHPDHTTKT